MGYKYIYVNGGMYAACHAYVMWVELGYYFFLYVPAVLNVVTTGNGTGATTVAIVSLLFILTQSTVSFCTLCKRRNLPV